MPTPIDILWEAVSNNEFDKVLLQVQSNEALVNEIDEDGYSLSIRILFIPCAKPVNLLGFLLGNKNLQVAYLNPETKESVVNAVFSTKKPEFLETLLKNPKAIKNENGLAYTTGKNSLNLAINSLNREQKTKPNSPNIPRLTANAETLKSMLEMTREATIRQAITTDDTSLLMALHKEGANVTAPFKDGTEPQKLCSADKPQVTAWFKKHEENKQAAQKAAASMSALRSVEQQIDAATTQHLESQTRVMQNATQRQMGLLERVVSAFVR